MKSKQVLSVEQMKHLQELGLDTSDASMVLIATDDDGITLLWEDAEKAIKHHWYNVYLIYITLKQVVTTIRIGIVVECLPCRTFSTSCRHL